MSDEFKSPIKLRERLMSSGNRSLYLDMHINGKRQYEYLKLYLVPEQTAADRRMNKNTLALAQSILAQRQVEYQTNRFGLANYKRGRQLFLDLYEQFLKIKSNTVSESSLRKYGFLLKRLRLFDPDLDLRRVDEFTKDYCQDFIFSLLGDMKSSSSNIIFTGLNTVFSYACKQGIVDRNPCADVERPSNLPSERNFLTIEEMRKVAAYDAGKRNYLKDAFLFSCFTGLRKSDVGKLKWGDVQRNNDGGWRIVFAQKKTGQYQYLDLNEQAVQLMGERKTDEERVFHIPFAYNKYIAEIIKGAGIKKHITFHCARHTFATMLLTLDVDLFTVSKLLGHTNISTTQIYAKLVDKKRQEAVERIPKII